MLKDFKHHDPVNKVSVSPAAEHLLKIWDNTKPLSKTKDQSFH